MDLTENLDRSDLLILNALQNNARITNKELAAQVHLSPTPVASVLSPILHIYNKAYFHKSRV